MLVVPFVSEPLARTLTSAGWSWADGCGNFDPADIAFPDEVAASTLKAPATQVRTNPTDIVDVWRY